MYVCSCFGITESQVKAHAKAGACTPRQIASQCRAGTDCGGCVRRIQSILGRGACPRREPDRVAAEPFEPAEPLAPTEPFGPAAEPLAPAPAPVAAETGQASFPYAA
ncbi:(2Fe-2S)-binding protein [Streptomyces tremellae]|uniref:Bacterioferritin-associated ferredoxin n=1 Tax=Streptomyces tremellae TaxID=1124239 RepID=A0ABP7GD80_9ACTN